MGNGVQGQGMVGTHPMGHGTGIISHQTTSGPQAQGTAVWRGAHTLAVPQIQHPGIYPAQVQQPGMPYPAQVQQPVTMYPPHTQQHGMVLPLNGQQNNFRFIQEIDSFDDRLMILPVGGEEDDLVIESESDTEEIMQDNIIRRVINTREDQYSTSEDELIKSRMDTEPDDEEMSFLEEQGWDTVHY